MRAATTAQHIWCTLQLTTSNTASARTDAVKGCWQVSTRGAVPLLLIGDDARMLPVSRRRLPLPPGERLLPQLQLLLRPCLLPPLPGLLCKLGGRFLNWKSLGPYSVCLLSLSARRKPPETPCKLSKAGSSIQHDLNNNRVVGKPESCEGLLRPVADCSMGRYCRMILFDPVLCCGVPSDAYEVDATAVEADSGPLTYSLDSCAPTSLDCDTPCVSSDIKHEEVSALSLLMPQLDRDAPHHTSTARFSTAQLFLS